MSECQTQCADVIIIGAGPAGCSAAAVLAEAGLSVIVLERDHFPRYHIGESLLPFTCFPLRRLGLIEKMRKSEFIKKYSVQFVSPSGHASQPFYFSTRYEPDVAQTWQVLRSEFDVLLLQNATAKGAKFLHGVTVRDFLRDGGDFVGVKATDSQGGAMEFRAPVTVDCSGREALAAARMNWRVAEPRLNKVAVWTYYEGAMRDPGIDAGATTVAFVPEKGWFWYIPQHRNMVSVGVVAEGKYLTRDGVRDPGEIFQREVLQNKWIQSHLAPGKQVGKYFLTGEFSFRARYGAANGLVMAGDAFGFLDPVFSSGVMLALKSGIMAGEAIIEAHKTGDFSAEKFRHYTETLQEGLENMRKLVYAFYEEKFSFRELTDRYPDLAGDVTDCLSGDVNKDFSRLFSAIAEFASVPSPLPYGAPLQSAAPMQRTA